MWCEYFDDAIVRLSFNFSDSLEWFHKQQATGPNDNLPVSPCVRERILFFFSMIEKWHKSHIPITFDNTLFFLFLHFTLKLLLSRRLWPTHQQSNRLVLFLFWGNRWNMFFFLLQAFFFFFRLETSFLVCISYPVSLRNSFLQTRGLPFRMEVLNFFFFFFSVGITRNFTPPTFVKFLIFHTVILFTFFSSRSAKSTILQHARYLLKTCTTSTFLRLSSPWKSRNNRLFFFLPADTAQEVIAIAFPSELNSSHTLRPKFRPHWSSKRQVARHEKLYNLTLHR